MEICILFMAAGLSSRFGGTPKILSIIGPRKETILEMNIIQMKKYIVPTQIHIVCNNNTYNDIVNEFKRVCKKHNIDTNITYNIQELSKNREKPWGTADALSSACNYINGRVIVLNSDDIYGEKAFEDIKLYCNNVNNYLIGYKLINTLINNNKANRGFIYSENDKIESIVEKLDIEKHCYNETELENQYVSVNLFILNIDVLKEIKKMVKEFKDSNTIDLKIEAMLPNFINNLIYSNKIKLQLLKTDSKWCGVTFKDDIHIVRNLLI